MAESVVTFLLQGFSSLMFEKVKFIGGIREQVVFIKDELERIRAFLRNADAVEDDDEEIKVWVKQVRDVAFDSEDALDKFQLRLSSHNNHSFYLSKILCTIKILKARHRFAYELRGIKYRVISIAEGHRRYCYRMNSSISSHEEGSKSRSSTNTNSTLYDLRGDARLLDEAQLVGIDKPKNDLVRWLLMDSSSSLQVVAVRGMGGLGKTTLVNTVYTDDEVKKHFKHHAWIAVSQFKPDELLREIIQQLFDAIKKPFPVAANSTDCHKLKRILLDFLCEKKYLIVLDDVWSIDAWDALKFAFPSNCGSRLMLTSRISEVVSISTTELGGMIYDLKPLSSEESWTLFCARTFQGNLCPSYLEKISRNILKRCRGLPLAIVAISGMLATKDQSRVDEWEMVERSLGPEFESNRRLISMKKILSLSLNDLPYNLKSCFLYLSIFPEDYLIERSRLIKFWIAEGFVQAQERRTLEEVAEGYFNELLNRSLTHVAEKYFDGRIRACRVHDLLREIILHKSKNQNFVVIASPEDSNSSSYPEKVRRLSVHKTLETVQECHDLSKLRSLFFFGVSEDSFSNLLLSIFFNGQIRLLKVLDCRGVPLATFPKGITKLYNLRYLSLRDTKISSIPASIGNLENLETLDVRNTFVKELPSEILKIHGLGHLIVCRYIKPLSVPFQFVGFKALEKMETLSSLQSLFSIEVNYGGANLMTSLGKLKQMRRLGILKLRAEDGPILCSSIEKMRYLRTLSLCSREANEVLNVQNISSPPPHIQRLYMVGRLEMLPNWVSQLSSLTKLVLMWSKLGEDSLESLHSLPNLVELRFSHAYDGETLCFKTGCFQKLRTLFLRNLDKLRRVTVEIGTMPHLEQVVFENCKLLEEVPAGFEFLTNLKQINFVDMDDELISRLRQSDQDNDHFKIKHVPSIFIGRAEETSGPDGYYF